MDIDYEEEEELLFLSLDHLKTINGKIPTISNTTMDLFNDDIDNNVYNTSLYNSINTSMTTSLNNSLPSINLRQSDLEIVAILYDQIRA